MSFFRFLNSIEKEKGIALVFLNDVEVNAPIYTLPVYDN